MDAERRRIRVSGRVQGVGFRPFAYSAAVAKKLSGHVENSGAFVEIEVEGSTENIESFINTLETKAPVPTHIASITIEAVAAVAGEGFFIRRSSHDEHGTAFPSADIPVCDECLAEMNDPENRRYGYAMIGCSACGPRFTVTSSLPYDRRVTTMREFEMCDECREEYGNPADRRFHSQLNCCPKCGPDVAYRSAEGETFAAGRESVAAAAALIKSGKILAVKGLGGYHLACDATKPEVVERLRARKLRDEKPFAVMARDVEAAMAACEINEKEKALLTGPERAVVLLRGKSGSPVSEVVAPGNAFMGLMLPYAPVHHLLLKEVGPYLVMTSGNLSGEPIICDDNEAVAELSGVADGFLLNNRPIRTRCDDSVVRERGGEKYYIRRSRGAAPDPIKMNNTFHNNILACGGELKNTFCMGVGEYAYLSQHVGDLESGDTVSAFEDSVEKFSELLGSRPEALACDMHPEYLSTKYARRRKDKIPVYEIQHHHAHIASCMAENGWTGGPVIGIAFDGLGYGLDGALWGGEFLLADYSGFGRAAHLRYVPAPGGAAAIREPWRMALAWARAANCEAAKTIIQKRIGDEKMEIVAAMMSASLNSPVTSGMGRLFDAVSSLVLVRDEVSFEGQAAMELEQFAAKTRVETRYEYLIENNKAELLSWGECENIPSAPSALIIDPAPTIIGIVDDIANGTVAPEIAAKFHMTVADMIKETCVRIRGASGVSAVALSGGVFQNMLLMESSVALLEENGFEILVHREVPCNDGGLSLGQAVIASAMMKRK